MGNTSDFVMSGRRLKEYIGNEKRVEIPDGVWEISSHAFANNGSVEEIVIPDSVFSLCEAAFYRCGNLRYVSIPDAVKQIADKYNRQASPFEDCLALRAISIRDPSVLKPEYRFIAAVGFSEEDRPDYDPRYDVYHKLIKANVKKWMGQAVVTPALLGLMCREKMISAMLAPEYLEAAQTAGNAECVAMLLDYNATKLSSGEKRRAAKQKAATEDSVLTRKILRQDKVGIDGLVFVITGDLETFNKRDDLKEFITQKGGKLASSMSSKVDYLVMNDPSSNTEKKKRAEELGIEVITELQFNEKAGRQFQIDKAGVLVRFLGSGGDVVIPAGVTKIGDTSFWGCSGLRSVVIPEGVIRIGAEAFRGCDSLQSVVIPRSVSKIVGDAFVGCAALADRFGFVIVESQLFDYFGPGGDIVIPVGVKQIGDYAFFRCDSLRSLEIPASVKKIGDWAFGGCTNLQKIVIPKEIKKIGESAFYHCGKLTIHAPAGSYAETYAKENNIPFMAE